MNLMDMLRSQIMAQVLAYVIPILVTFILGWLAVLYAKLTGKNLDAKNRDALQSALENGIRFAIQQLLDGKLSPQGTVPADKKAAVMATAKSYVASSVPDAVKHFNLTHGELDTLLVPHLPLSTDKKAA